MPHQVRVNSGCQFAAGSGREIPIELIPKTRIALEGVLTVSTVVASGWPATVSIHQELFERTYFCFFQSEFKTQECWRISYKLLKSFAAHIEGVCPELAAFRIC